MTRNRFRNDGTPRRFSRDYVRSPAGRATPEILFRDEFATAAAAPLASTRICEPGSGRLTVTGAGQSIASGKLTIAKNAADEGFVAVDGIDRAEGNALIFMGVNASDLSTRLDLGWRAASSLGTNLHPGVRLASTLLSANNGASVIAVGSVATGTDYDFALITRATGVLVLYRVSGTIPWTLLLADDFFSFGPLFPQIRHNNVAAVIDRMFAATGIRVPRLYYSASGTIGTVTLPTANFHASVRTTSTAAQELRFRIQDSSNYWRLARDADSVDLIKKVAGSDTTVATAAMTPATGDRLVVMCDAQTIRSRWITSGGVATALTAQTSASEFETATGIAIGTEAAYADLEAFGRVQNLDMPLFL